MNTQDTVPNNSDNSLERISRSKRLFGWLTLIFGLGVVIPPMIGLIGTVIGMVGAFGTLETSGASDPGELAGDISIALLTTFWGMIFAVLSLIPFVIFLIIFLKRRKTLRALITK